ncbi:hypothetical protein I5Q34_30455 [Streptomyces sp. AV19]|uniref:hypothetical protein n=1 Tax=Streptomyces sp. AV19 TaxID=2793068 RepID=UPI0018FE55A6|nr:hypothetical protein [Streptomyces sp. AV19]MBH1938531.1 hypothetical protein [Streptomyces sp. AV19]MDG4535180.1 hypothetical protein [Streptomyces sp. AV19]
MEFDSCLRSHAEEIRPAAGAVLCAACIRQLDRQLRALPDLHQECLHHVLAVSRQRIRTKVSGSRRRDHLNMSALDARNDVLAILESWSGFVADELGTAVPARSVHHLASFLLRHLEWLVARHPAADFAAEIETLHGELLRTIDPDHGDRRAPAVECVVDDCTGTINALPQRSGGGNAGKNSISCSSGHSWEVREWLTLRHLMGRRRKDAA